jgi:choline-phosphate cytidylyltransferase
MVPNCFLIVGICCDKDIEENKGSVVMNDEERVESVRHCKWVDEIHFPAPWSPTIKFLDSIKADLIAHDTMPYETADSSDCYLEFKLAGRFLPTLRTEGISTSSILTKILKERVQFYEKNLKRGVSREELNLSYIEYLYI